MNEKIKLLPCPFCGGECSAEFGPWISGIDHLGLERVRCQPCEFSGPPGVDAGEAEGRWNKRADAPAAKSPKTLWCSTCYGRTIMPGVPCPECGRDK